MTGRVLAVLVTLLGVLTACAGSAGNAPDPTNPGWGTVVADAPLTGLDPALVDASSWARVMTYRSRSGVDEDNSRVTGSVFVPKGEPPPGGFPIVVVAPEVIGTAPDCAASGSPTLLGNATVIVQLLNAGYVVFVPDYQGLGAPSGGGKYHPYADSTTAGYVIIDGVRATKNLAPVPTSTSWAALGNFEGGQAAWAVNELADTNGWSLKLVATASVSPLADFEGLVDEAVAGTLSPEQKLVYIAYLAAMKNEHQYDVNLDDYRRGVAQQNWDTLLSCQGDRPLELAAQIPPEDLQPSTPDALATIRGYLQKTTLPQGPTAAPMYVIYGGRDPVIPPQWTEQALARACQMGDSIQITYLPDQGHREIPPEAASGWLIDRLQGNPAANDCDSFLVGRDLSGLTVRPPVERRVAHEPDNVVAVPRPPGVSLTAGWLPITIEVVTFVALALAIGRRSRHWLVHWIPGALMVGFATSAAVGLFIKNQGWTERAPSWQTMFWIAAIGFAIGVGIFGWPNVRWWRRVVSVAAVVLCVLTAGVALNTATGYFPTVSALSRQLTGAQPPGWVDVAAVDEMVRSGVRPTEGTMVWVDIPSDGSGFAHRREAVYLPPAWFASNPPPRLPVVMMLGAEFSQPSAWPVAAQALQTLDRFAAAHRGNAPVVVFPDTTGSFSNDTECVNGPRGQAADHLTKDVVPYIISTFDASPDPSQWGMVGWSAGGTCALMTAVMNPGLFSAFVDLDGQLGPNMGTKPQTVARLFGGDESAWEAFDPRTVVEKHGQFPGMAAWVGVSNSSFPPQHWPAGDTVPDDLGDWSPYSEEHEANARKLCKLLSGHGIECSVVAYDGLHDFNSAGLAFAKALPWLAGRLGTPGVPRRALPGAS